MFVPVVPYVPHTTIINKTIVYSDTVLPLKDSGSNLKVASISNVSESSLESCLKKVFESNPNTTFNTIQYSKNDKKVYFYTDKDITTKGYEESRIYKHKPITSSSEILEEVKRILVSENNKDNDCISLYDISKLLKNMDYRYKSMKKSYDSSMEYTLNSHYSKPKFVLYDFDYETDELRIGFGLWDYDMIRFSKRNDDLYITKSETSRAKDVLAIIGDKLSKAYDEFIKHKDYMTQHNYGFKAINSNFLVDFSHHGVSISVKSLDNQFMNDFQLSSPSYDNKYQYDCNSSIVVSAFKGKEAEILKRIFVKIEDCPKWAQQSLYEIRQNQLAEKQRIEDERNYQEMKKQKRLELKRKIFPWIKT